MNKTIENKYNKLFKEVAKYYHLDHKVRTGTTTRLHFIKIGDFGYMDNSVITTSVDNADNVRVHLEENFTYLAPFYKYFHRDHFCKPGLPDSRISLLKDINKVITKIRREESIKKVIR